MSEKPKTSCQHDFEFSYGECVSPKLARKVMRDIYKMVEYQKALKEIVTPTKSDLHDYPVLLSDGEMFKIAKEALNRTQ